VAAAPAMAAVAAPPRRFVFVGVSTAGSSIQKIFPAWMAHLGHNCALQVNYNALPRRAARTQIYLATHLTLVSETPSVAWCWQSVCEFPDGKFIEDDAAPVYHPTLAGSTQASARPWWLSTSPPGHRPAAQRSRIGGGGAGGLAGGEPGGGRGPGLLEQGSLSMDVCPRHEASQ
jgi:hypothetical protein